MMYWSRYDPREHLAHTKLNRAVKLGRIKKPANCESCGEAKRLSGHHDDYDKPLDVRWLCAKCHRRFHSGTLRLPPKPR